MDLFDIDAKRDLNKEEKSLISTFFPNAEVDKMRYLGKGGEVIETSVTTTHPLCDQFSCLDNKIVTKAYFSSNGSYAGDFDPTFKPLICARPEYKCVDFNIFYVTYNCIGWALGISKWLNPNEITSYIKNEGLNHYQAIDKFLHYTGAAFSPSHKSNFERIIDKLSTNVSSINSQPLNNTVAFYFKGKDCLHGSRYLKSFNDEPFDSWTSKLGRSILVSHDDDDLLGPNSSYGDTIFLAGLNVQDKIHHDHDEL